MAPEKLPSQKESSLPTTISQGRAVKLQGGREIHGQPTQMAISEFFGLIANPKFTGLSKSDRKSGTKHSKNIQMFPHLENPHGEILPSPPQKK